MMLEATIQIAGAILQWVQTERQPRFGAEHLLGRAQLGSAQLGRLIAGNDLQFSITHHAYFYGSLLGSLVALQVANDLS